MTLASNDGAGPIASDLVRDDPDFADLVTAFVDGLTDRLKTIEQAARSCDFDGIKMAAHQLKGAAGGYGYPVLTDAARQLESLALSQSLDACCASIDELRHLIARVVVTS